MTPLAPATAMATAASPAEPAKPSIFNEQEMHAWGVHPAAVKIIMANPEPYNAIIANVKSKGQADIDIARQLKADTGNLSLEVEAVIEEAAINVSNYAMTPKDQLRLRIIAVAPESRQS